MTQHLVWRLLRVRCGSAKAVRASVDALRKVAGGSGAAASRRHPTMRLRVQCMLLLHVAWLGTLTLLTLGSILGRQQRGRLLAERMLAAQPTSGGGELGATANAHSIPSTEPNCTASFASAQKCGEALRLPQVALLFLVKGPIHHEALWRLWFQSAEGLLPLEALHSTLCDGSSAGESSSSSSGSKSSSGGINPSTQLGGRQAASQPLTEAKPEPGYDALAGHGRQLQQPLSAHSMGSVGGSSTPRVSTDTTTVVGDSSTVLPASGVLGRQRLFDVYVHPHPSFGGYPAGHLFRGRELPAGERVATEWGQHSLVDATRALLRAAHRNPRNVKFVLLSESDLPLYSPQALYTQLLSERVSRLNACNTTAGWRLFDHRWVPRMETQLLKPHHWRKSWQFFALERRHVDLVLSDSAVDASFRAHCRTMFEEERGKERECYSDEHYIPTLLAVHGRDNETDCQGWLMDTDWSRVSHISPHPWEYRPKEVIDRLLYRLRHPELPGCGHAVQFAATARIAFVPAAELEQLAAPTTAGSYKEGGGDLAGTCGQLRQRMMRYKQQYRPLGPRCRMLARKFLNTTAAAALAAVAPCDSSTLILNDGTCPGETPGAAARRRAWQRVAPLVLLALGSLLLPLLTALCLATIAGPSSAASRRRAVR